MIELLKNHKASTFVTIVLIVVASAVQIYAGYLLTLFYNIIVSSNLTQAILFALQLIFWWSCSNFLTYLAACSQAKVIQFCNIDLRDKIVNKISYMTFEEYSGKEPGEFVSWTVNDVEQIEKNTFTPFFEMINAVFMIIFSTIALTYMHPIILCACIISASILSIVPKVFSKRIEQIAQSLSESNAFFSQKAFNIISGFEVFFTFNKLPIMRTKIKETYENLEHKKTTFKKKRAQMELFSSSIFRICELSVSTLTAILAFYGVVGIGVIFSISNIYTRFLNGVNSLLTSTVLFVSTRTILKKFDFTPLKSDKKNCKEISHSIVLKDLSISFGQKDIVKHCDYEFLIGKKYAIVGESGSGKSTIVKSIIGLLNSYTGEVLFDGVDRKEYSVESILSQIAYINQTPYIFNDTFRFNLTLSDTYGDEELYRVLKLVNLTEFTQALPNGLDYMFSENGRNISGGEKQRISIARALLRDKHIFVIDEGTSALDSKNAHMIEDLFLNDPMFTIIFITHHLSDKTGKLEKVYTI